VSPGEHEDRGNRWVLIAFALIGLLSAYVPAYTDRIGFWTLDGDKVRWVGVLLFAAGGALRIWPVFVLGRRFSGLVAIQPGHALGWSLSCRPESELSRVARQHAGMGARISVSGRRVAHCAHRAPAARPHTRRGAPAAQAIRRRICRLLPPYIATDSRRVLT
jgi:hypothetical protein